MYQLPHKVKGTVLTAANWNNSVDAIQDALNRSSDFQTMLPSVPNSGRWIRRAVCRQQGRLFLTLHDQGGANLDGLFQSW